MRVFSFGLLPFIIFLRIAIAVLLSLYRIPVARCKPFFKISVSRPSIGLSRNSVLRVNASTNFPWEKKIFTNNSLWILTTEKAYILDEPQSVIDADKSPTKMLSSLSPFVFLSSSADDCRRRYQPGSDGPNWALDASPASVRPLEQFIDATYR